MKIKINYKRKILPKNIWLGLLAIIIVFMLISTMSTILAYQEPVTTEEKNTVLTYSGNSQFDYLSTLINNTVYNKTLLRPGEGIIFKQIVDNITGTHQYQFQISESATISSSYSLRAIIQTDLWTKTYTLIPTKTSESTGTRLTLTESYPIDFRFYDSILTTINEETGINAPNPLLLIQASITVSAKTSEYTIFETFNPEITMSLNQKTIEFSDLLSLSKSGSKTETITIEHPEVEETQQARLYTSIASVIILFIYLAITKMKPTEITALEQELNKIQKKYGEWLVTAESNPVDPLSKQISIASMEELSRISEDLGKPMIHYQKNKSMNIFIVIDDEHIYQHELKVENEKEESGFFSFFSFDKSDENKIDPTKAMKSIKKKDAISEQDKPRKMITRTVNCKHCKSSFTVEEETNGQVKRIEIACPYCGTTQKVNVETKKGLGLNFSSFLKKKEKK